MTTSLQHMLREHRAELFAEWLRLLEATGAREGLPGASTERLSGLFEEILALLERPPADSLALDPEDSLARHLRQLVADQARRGGGSRESVDWFFSLKRLILARLIKPSPAHTGGDLLWLDLVFDQLALLAFASFVDIRERLIAQQSLSLLELSTPVLRLWHRILLLPLVGVIDTVRARQITESLLEAIARYEARVTILDLTGVPVLDTSVAQHLMKTMDASRLLGTRIVMTGISPEGAQTLTKLGIRFADVTSRATLRAGIAEALLMVGQRIAPLEVPRS